MSMTLKSKYQVLSIVMACALTCTAIGGAWAQGSTASNKSKSTVAETKQANKSTKLGESSTPIPADTVLGKGLYGTTITAADVMAEFAKLPPENRLAVMGKPESVGQITNNLLVRRILAKELENDKLDKDPVIQAGIALAKDRILSDIRLQYMDGQNDPKEEAVEKYARNLYQANLAKHAMPAQTRARHILIEKATPENLQKIKDLLSKIKGGESFEELAKAHSEDKGSGARGGDLGFFRPGQMVKPFEDAANALAKPGDVSEPVESQFGWHIIKLEERRAAGTKPFEEVKPELMREAKIGLINEGRLQKVKTLNQNMSFDRDAIAAFSKAASN
jgi:peptidyl-prolyl cis-trans isomerase C